MTRVRLEIVTMVGSDYVTWDSDGLPTFPHGDLDDGESVPAAARRIVHAFSQTENPKLELIDIRSEPGAVTLVLRAMLVSDPQGKTRRFKRMELPERVGSTTGRSVEEALKTSIAYKLTRA